MKVPVAIRRDLCIAVVIVALLIAVPTAADAMWGPEPEAVMAGRQVQATASDKHSPEPEGEDPQEDEKITEALRASGYYRDDVPLSYEEQDFLHTAAEDAGIPYELALAVIRKETDFRNVVGDDGESVGYMQVQEKWHRARMERLGVEDLSDPFGNFEVGCDYLAELLWRFDNLKDVLTFYNSGHAGDSRYARDVIEYWGEYGK